MFNDDIQHFDGLFKRNKTYIISNGHVQKSNPQYATAHPTLEIVLKKQLQKKLQAKAMWMALWSTIS